ncbi:MAG: hypothetical protein WC528_03645 [Patescibacteria group bacterium]
MPFYYWLIIFVIGIVVGDILTTPQPKRRNPLDRIGTIVAIRENDEDSVVSVVLKEPLAVGEYIDLGDPAHVFRVAEMFDRNGQPVTEAKANALVNIILPPFFQRILPGTEVWIGCPAPLALAVNGG